MRNGMRNYGFTMAEMLVVVAIIVVLGGVGFIAVQQHQRSLNQLDRDAVAKEIFIAAQNHLSMAKSENYQGITDFGTKGNATADTGNNDIFYIYSGSNPKPAIYDQILPFGAIDGTILGNSFIIRYQPKAAVVLDVFYWTSDSENNRFDCDLNASNYAALVGDGKGDKHNNYDGNGLLGWFGDQEVVKSGEVLNAPDIEVVNAEQLYVTIKDNNSLTTVQDVHLKLILTGVSSGAKAAIECKVTSGNRISRDPGTGKYKIVLDDITTANMHFSQINTDADFERPTDGASFIPGEDVIVQAVSYSNTELASVAYSGEWTTNSLFGEISQKESSVLLADTTAEIMKDTSYTVTIPDKDAIWITAKISSIRHLENLDARVSYLDNNDSKNKINITNAMQTNDLDWKDGFLKYFGGNATLYDAGGKAAKPNCFIPVKPSYITNGSEFQSIQLNYEGKSIEALVEGGNTICKPINHKVRNIEVDNISGDMSFTAGGLFESVNGGSIKNLELLDMTVNMSSGNAGALAGTLTDTAVTNVLAHHSAGKKDIAKITTTSGSAGGLIGSIAGTTSVSKSAAAVLVESKEGDAGGLVGKSTSTGTISGCYSGGHTIEKKSGDTVIGVIYDKTEDQFNVTASDAAGGLIGNAGSTAISYSYSTCSAIGTTVGGLIGMGSGNITSSYCTGLVKSTAETPVAGAFAAECTGTTTDCHYFEIINEDADDTVGYSYLTAIPETDTSDGSKDGVTALDDNADSYNAFTNTGNWSDAVPYQKTTLMSYYGVGTGDSRVPKYNLKSVEQLLGGPGKLKIDANDTTDYFVATHYGDWPAPEIFVVNTEAE